MAEGTTLHNLLAKQMAEGKIGPNEAGSRKAVNFSMKTFADAKTPEMKKIAGELADMGKSSIKKSRIEDAILKSKK